MYDKMSFDVTVEIHADTNDLPDWLSHDDVEDAVHDFVREQILYNGEGFEDSGEVQFNRYDYCTEPSDPIALDANDSGVWIVGLPTPWILGNIPWADAPHWDRQGLPEAPVAARVTLGVAENGRIVVDTVHEHRAMEAKEWSLEVEWNLKNIDG